MEIILPNEEAWRAERRKGIGASDAAAILGMSKWKSNLHLWEEKVGLREPDDISDEPYIIYGHAAEPHVRALFALDHPELDVRYQSPYKIIRSDKYPFIQASPDGELVEKSTGRWGGLEIKTSEIFSPSDWKYWDNRVPDEYYCQCLWQMIAAEWEFVWLRAQIKYRKNRQLRIDTREYLIEREEVKDDIKYVLEAGIKFWHRVTTKQRPALILPRI